MNRKAIIEDKLRSALAPLHLEVEDETRNHSVPEDAQSHYRVVAVSEVFQGKPLIQRHRIINKALEAELAGGIHALALHTMTPEEWFNKGGEAPQSPPCLGGGKKQ
ncbi:BolA family protein [Thiolapillus brandeum]|uniref:Cell division protein BolA n=1 Tax=Thiolapillus brandeum TaxID=1076588 RepID=A0A7U6GKE1_9GAMM|nr:BolA/IbaG family iron-sulfur metabolism protein [Thiolapillus brandeum]BAO45268.1 cell division protein BolA [Thiolapillus brandeum]